MANPICIQSDCLVAFLAFIQRIEEEEEEKKIEKNGVCSLQCTIYELYELVIYKWNIPSIYECVLSKKGYLAPANVDSVESRGCENLFSVRFRAPLIQQSNYHMGFSCYSTDWTASQSNRQKAETPDPSEFHLYIGPLLYYYQYVVCCIFFLINNMLLPSSYFTNYVGISSSSSSSTCKKKKTQRVGSSTSKTSG